MEYKKYEFLTKSTATKYVNELQEPYIAHVVVLGFLPIEKAEYDAEGNVTKEAVLCEKYSIDVLWESDIEDRWNTYEVQPEVSSHRFA